MAYLASVCGFARRMYSPRKLFASSLILLSTCIIVVFWTQLHLGSGTFSYKTKHGHTTTKFFTVIASLDQHTPGISIESKLLQAVNKLPFRVMTPSSLLLEDLYFIPSTHKLEHYDNPVLQQPQVKCQSEYLLILVPSHIESVRQRRAIRETWGSVARGRAWPGKRNNYSVKLIFVLGIADNSLNTEDLGSSVRDSPKLEKSRTYRKSDFVGNKLQIFSQTDDNLNSEIFNAKMNNITNSGTEKYGHDRSFKRSKPLYNINKFDDKRRENQSVTNPNLKRFADQKVTVRQENGNPALSLLTDQLSTSPMGTKSYIFKANTDLIPEISSFDDILQFDMIDSYANLTRKIILSLRWSVKLCPSAKFILKVDPDVFVNVPLLTTFLKHYGEINSVYGHIYPNSLVNRDGKWAVSKSALPIPRYPIYAAGNAYVLSKNAAVKITKLAPHFLYVGVEDAFITGILASVGGVNRVNVAGFTKWTESRPDPCDFVTDRKYVGNNFTEYDHRIFWREIVDNGSGRCDR